MRRWLFVAVLSLVMTPMLSVTAGASPQVPRGWKLVTHRGVGIDVPATWAVEPWHGCGVGSPTVLIGPEQPTNASCPSADLSVALVIFGSLPLAPHTWRHTIINDLGATVATQQVPVGDGQAVTTIDVRLPSKGMTISISVGDATASPGGAPGRAEQILHSIHSASQHDGIVTGTAAPCIGRPISHFGETWRVRVGLYRGTTIVDTEVVTDTLRVGRTMSEQRFVLRAPSGTYVIGTAASKQTVVIKAGKTVSVALQNQCR